MNELPDYVYKQMREQFIQGFKLALDVVEEKTTCNGKKIDLSSLKDKDPYELMQEMMNLKLSRSGYNK